MPPVKKKTADGKSSAVVVRYDSVKGNTGGSDVYMIYSNRQGYPKKRKLVRAGRTGIRGAAPSPEARRASLACAAAPRRL